MSNAGVPPGDAEGKGEQAWYILKTLHLLGETDLSSKVPKKQMRPVVSAGGSKTGETKVRRQLENEIAFLKTGELLPLTPKESEELSKARKNVKK